MERVFDKQILLTRVSHHKTWVSGLFGVLRPECTHHGVQLKNWRWGSASLNWKLYDTFCPNQQTRYCVLFAVETKFSLN
jgi:hypothetical protein